MKENVMNQKVVQNVKEDNVTDNVSKDNVTDNTMNEEIDLEAQRPTVPETTTSVPGRL